MDAVQGFGTKYTYYMRTPQIYIPPPSQPAVIDYCTWLRADLQHASGFNDGASHSTQYNTREDLDNVLVFVGGKMVMLIEFPVSILGKTTTRQAQSAWQFGLQLY